MAMNDLNITNDLKGFRRGELWQQKAYFMWYRMWSRVSNNSYYKNCNIHDSFRLFSNFIKWLELEPRFEEFKATCHEVRWTIDKDIKDSGNRNYYPECMSLVTQSDNNKEMNVRRRGKDRIPYGKGGNSSNHSTKAIIGISIKDNSILVFNSIKEASESGFNSGNICSCIKGLYKSSKGYRWFYLDLIEL